MPDTVLNVGCPASQPDEMARKAPKQKSGFVSLARKIGSLENERWKKVEEPVMQTGRWERSTQTVFDAPDGVWQRVITPANRVVE